MDGIQNRGKITMVIVKIIFRKTSTKGQSPLLTYQVEVKIAQRIGQGFLEIETASSLQQHNGLNRAAHVFQGKVHVADGTSQPGLLY